MGRKDAQGTHLPPVENYRKQIGKQDIKKGKKDAKAEKLRVDQKRSAMTIQETILVGGAVFALLLGLYLTMLWLVGPSTIEGPLV